jgi:hypothetical protein
LSLSSCHFLPPRGGSAPFPPPGQPRYGFNGSQSPNYREPAALPMNGQGNAAAPTGTADTKPKPPKTIKRDPNNTTVDLTPPTGPAAGATDAGTSSGNTGSSEPAASGTGGTTPMPDSGTGSTTGGSTAGSGTPADSGTTPAPKPSPREDLPYGIPVITKKGCVYSPHAPDKGYVDVEGLARGTRVKCPYTGKHFRVP